MHDAQVKQERQAADQARRPKHGRRRYQQFRVAGARAQFEPKRSAVLE